MKIVIFEGLDRCFKSTNVKRLYNWWMPQTSHMIHYSGVKNFTGNDAKKYSYQLYDEMFQFFEIAHQKNWNLILDRSHLGEHVYSKYRNYDGGYIWSLERKWEKHPVWDSIYLVYLTDAVENILDREDGNSFSDQYDKKKAEKEKFDEAFFLSGIKKKKLIHVTCKDQDQVFSEVLDAVGESYLNNIQIDDKNKEILENLVQTFGKEKMKKWIDKT